jgi:hypothetical protein
MPETWSKFVSRLKAAHAESASEASENVWWYRVAAILWLILLVVSASSAPHDYAVFKSELSATPVAQIIASHATGQFGESVEHVNRMLGYLGGLILTVRDRLPWFVFFPLLLVIMAAFICLMWLDHPVAWLVLCSLGICAFFVAFARRVVRATR